MGYEGRHTAWVRHNGPASVGRKAAICPQACRHSESARPEINQMMLPSGLTILSLQRLLPRCTVSTTLNARRQFARIPAPIQAPAASSRAPGGRQQHCEGNPTPERTQLAMTASMPLRVCPSAQALPWPHSPHQSLRPLGLCARRRCVGRLFESVFALSVARFPMLFWVFTFDRSRNRALGLHKHACSSGQQDTGRGGRDCVGGAARIHRLYTAWMVLIFQ
jgi:hypothetical protein